MPTLLQVRTGQPATHGGHRTAYGKQPRHGPVAVGPLGLDGDAVGDSRVHGGPDKAVYAYGAANFPHWIAAHPQHERTLVPGAFGENLLFDEKDEASVCIGDRWQVGSAILSPCQPRQPCSTLARWFGDPRMVKAMVENGLSGWYCRVVKVGTLGAGDQAVLLDRPNPDWPIARVLTVSYAARPNQSELTILAAVPGLADSWAAWAARQAQAARPKAKPL